MRSVNLCFAILLVAVTGCRQVVGFDDTASGPVDATVGDEPGALPVLPQAQYVEGCTSCAADKCGTEQQACLGDANCKALLRCRGGCRNPLCIARCGSIDVLDYAESVDAIAGRRGAENQNFAAYHRCVSRTQCVDACGSGLDWNCTAKDPGYRWPLLSDPNPYHLQLELLDELGNGVSARVTPYAAQTATPYALTPYAPTAGWGQAELEIPSGASDDVLLQIESSPDALDEFRMLDYSGPFFRNTRLSRNVWPVGWAVYPHSGFAGVFAIATDCLGDRAPGITFELDGASGQAYAYAPINSVSPGPATGATGMGGFADVSPANGTITITARAKGDVIVARRRVELRENWLTSVVLRPLTEGE